jgi:hypothetical protein
MSMLAWDALELARLRATFRDFVFKLGTLSAQRLRFLASAESAREYRGGTWDPNARRRKYWPTIRADGRAFILRYQSGLRKPTCRQSVSTVRRGLSDLSWEISARLDNSSNERQRHLYNSGSFSTNGAIATALGWSVRFAHIRS